LIYGLFLKNALGFFVADVDKRDHRLIDRLPVARFAARMLSARRGEGVGAFGLRQSSGALDAAAVRRESGRALPHSKTPVRLPGHGFISRPPPQF